MNPYAIIISLLLAAGLFVSGATLGYRYSQGEQAKVTLENANAAALAARQATQTEDAASLQAAQRSATAKIVALKQAHAIELELAKDETARHCGVSAGTFSVLQQSIDAANSASPAISIDAPVRTTGATLKPDSSGSGTLGGLKR